MIIHPLQIDTGQMGGIVPTSSLVPPPSACFFPGTRDYIMKELTVNWTHSARRVSSENSPTLTPRSHR